MSVDPCIIVQFLVKIQQDATVYQTFIIPYLYEAQHVSGYTPPVIRSLKMHKWPLVLHTWKVDGRCQVVTWQHPATTRPTTFRVWKTRGCQCSFRFLMMGGVSPETCRASYKYGIINFSYIVESCWFFFVNCTMMHGSTDIKFNTSVWLAPFELLHAKTDVKKTTKRKAGKFTAF